MQGCETSKATGRSHATYSCTTPATWSSARPEAFTPEQLAELYDVNVLGTQRLNRAALPHLRAREAGLLVWVSSTSVKGGAPPYLGPYFAAKAGMDSLAVTYAGVLARFGIETSIVVPGSFTRGTNHFAHSGHPGDDAVAKAYELHYAGLMEQVAEKLAALSPPNAHPAMVSQEIARIVALPHGQRPYRVHIDPRTTGRSASARSPTPSVSSSCAASSSTTCSPPPDPSDGRRIAKSWGGQGDELGVRMPRRLT